MKIIDLCQLWFSQFSLVSKIHFLGGPLAVTDANLVLGRLLPDYFPKIFGKTEDQPLDKKATIEAFEKLTHEVTFHIVVDTDQIYYQTDVFYFYVWNFLKLITFIDKSVHRVARRK